MNQQAPLSASKSTRHRPRTQSLQWLFGALLLTIFASSHAAEGNKATTSKTSTSKATVTVFSDRERNAILSHYSARQHDAEVYAQYHESGKGRKDGNKALPPGLQKKAEQGRLPPGWQKKLKVGSKIPPDIFAVAEPLPPALVAQLPAGPAGTITVHVDGQIIRVVEATRTIVDFFGLGR